MSLRLVLVTACALIDMDGRVLIAERPPGKPMAGLWEFPGGKVHEGERPEETLIRELNEELGIVVQEACLAPLTFASHSYPDFHLLMPLYVCRRWEGLVTPREGQRLTWVRPCQPRATCSMRTTPWPWHERRARTSASSRWVSKLRRASASATTCRPLASASSAASR